MKIITRDQWGARPAVGRSVAVAASERSVVVVHHTTGETLGKGDPAAWVRSIQRYHQSVQGWADVGYHWLVAGDGTVFEGRGWDVVGAHCPGHNTDGWGIALLGDGNTTVPAAALASIQALIDEAERRAGHDLERLGHRDARQTACPGSHLYAWVHGEEPSAPPASTGTAAAPPPPAFPLERGNYYGEDGVERGEGLRRWQSRMKLRGWRIEPDGAWGPQTDGVTAAFQKEKGLEVDHKIGPITWAAAWTEPVT